MDEIRIPANHPAIWGKGYIISSPVWSVMIGGYVLMFKPEAESFSLLVPADELTTD